MAYGYWVFSLAYQNIAFKEIKDNTLFLEQMAIVIEFSVWQYKDITYKEKIDDNLFLKKYYFQGKNRQSSTIL